LDWAKLAAHEANHRMTDEFKHSSHDAVAARVKHDFNQALPWLNVNHVSFVSFNHSIVKFKAAK
jgi:hypothetical protein